MYKAFIILVWQPFLLTRIFKKQGISGQKYRFLYGNIDEINKMKRESHLSILDRNTNDIFPRIFPHYQQWIPEFFKLVGMKGLVFVEGVDWVCHRRILNPAFSIDRLKVMTKVMVECTLKMLNEWGDVKREQKIEMNREFRRLTADIIATAAFGSSYNEGVEYLPTPLNIRIWKLDRKMKNSVKKIVDSRLQSKQDYGDDLLGIMLKSCDSERKERKLSIEEIIDECKTFFFAGYETNLNLLTCLIIQVFFSSLFCFTSHMNMVFLEPLRLYGPVSFFSRDASKDLTLGNLQIPKGTTIVFPLMKMHSDKAVWGSDADKFNPLQFENSVSRAASHPNALLAFSMGPRVCIGQNFAMIEARSYSPLSFNGSSLPSPASIGIHQWITSLLTPQYGLPVMLQLQED
ncbi:hypothetical protein N665_1268s0007 [Sinapis alba]|nr:hypothetical protein N665_1268s0007 [Sinapis alba]